MNDFSVLCDIVLPKHSSHFQLKVMSFNAIGKLNLTKCPPVAVILDKLATTTPSFLGHHIVYLVLGNTKTTIANL